MAEKTGRISNLFPDIMNLDKEENGIYAMTIYSLGVPFTQIVDDRLLMTDYGLVFSDLGDDGSFWGAIVEKMLAKWWGNYEHTVGGYMDQAVSALNGSPATWMNNYDRDWSTG